MAQRERRADGCLRPSVMTNPDPKHSGSRLLAELAGASHRAAEPASARSVEYGASEIILRWAGFNHTTNEPHRSGHEKRSFFTFRRRLNPFYRESASSRSVVYGFGGSCSTLSASIPSLGR